MAESLDSELIHLTCPHCQKITSLSLASLAGKQELKCPFCGEQMPVDPQAAREDGHRKALELDQAEDSLGSVE